MSNHQSETPLDNSLLNKSWHIASRWQEYEGEMRSALLRSILVAIFYAVQLVHFLSLPQIADSDRMFHRQVTFSAVAWLFLSLAVFIALKGGFMPPFLKYVTTAIDLALVTLLAWLGHGSSSPLVMALFLVLVLSAIRFRIGLIWFASLGAMTCYMILVASTDKTWFDRDHTTPILTQAITLCSMGATGMVLGQIVRASRTMATAFLSRAEGDLSEVAR
jgi:hypothetical protein